MKEWDKTIEYTKTYIGKEQSEILSDLKNIGYTLLQSISIYNESKLEMIIQYGQGTPFRLVVDKNTKLNNGYLEIDLFNIRKER